MNCSKCGGATAVVDSRPYGNGIRRRRACTECGHRESTVESLIGNDLRTCGVRDDPHGNLSLRAELAIMDRTVTELRTKLRDKTKLMTALSARLDSHLQESASV